MLINLERERDIMHTHKWSYCTQTFFILGLKTMGRDSKDVSFGRNKKIT